MSKRPELMIANGPLAGQRFRMKEGGLRLGRSSSNDIHVPDEELSRNHCLFESAGDQEIRLTDLASANGTIVNGKPLGNDPVEIKVGDVIEVGSTVVRIVGEKDSADSVSDIASGNAKADRDFSGGTAAKPTKEARRRSPFANVLWAFAVLFAAAAIYLVLNVEGISRSFPRSEIWKINFLKQDK